MVLRGRFNFGELSPQFIQLLEKVTNSGRYFEKLNVSEGLNRPPGAMYGFLRSSRCVEAQDHFAVLGGLGFAEGARG